VPDILVLSFDAAIWYPYWLDKFRPGEGRFRAVSDAVYLQWRGRRCFLCQDDALIYQTHSPTPLSHQDTLNSQPLVLQITVVKQPID
jgi:hypothetical protein